MPELWFRAGQFDPRRLAIAADWLVAAIAAVLPWSTSAVSILVVVWVLVLLPTLSFKEMRAALLSPMIGLTLVLFLLGAVGMLWAQVPWPDRLGGLDGFVKLLAIPLLATQFRRSPNGCRVYRAFLYGCIALLIGSIAVAVWPGLPRGSHDPGVIVKAYIVQSIEFTMCAAVLLDLSLATARRRQRLHAAGLAALGVAFLADILFIATGRTALVVIVALALLYGFRHSGWRGTLVGLMTCVLLASIVWSASPYLRERVRGVFTESEMYLDRDKVTSAGERIAFWKRSLEFIESAPFVGHGTGSITSLFRKAAVGRAGPLGEVSTNPHNQTFAVGIQLGLVGIGVLWLMWIAQLKGFWRTDFIGWVGLVVVTQNIVGSLFNSFMFDFTEGWIYVIGFGVSAGLLRKLKDEQKAPLPMTAEENSL